MALGFDMTDPIVDPAKAEKRIEEWKRLFPRWDHQPDYAGRYFGLRKHNWVEGEIPKDLRSLVPNFNKLKYILPLAPSGVPTSDVTVDYDGNIGAGDYAFFYRQAGCYTNGFEREEKKEIVDFAKEEAIATCKSIADNIKTEWDPVTDSSVYKGDLKLPSTLQVFVFLSVEPWTRLHHVFWNTWADVVFTYPVAIDVPGRDFSFNINPFLPCLYCDVNLTDGPRLSQVRDIFNNIEEYSKASRCYALMTPYFHAGNYELGTLYNVLVSEESIRREFLANFSFAPLRQEIGNYPNAEILIWQYFINYVLDESVPEKDQFKIDFSLTTDAGYANRPVTDFMLEINW